MFTWLPMTGLPSVPQHFVDRAFDIVKDPNFKSEISGHYNKNSNSHSFEERKLLIDGKEINTMCLRGKRLGDDWEQWVKENVVSNFVNTGVRISLGEDTSVHGAHADQWAGDPPRATYKFYYLLDAGGDSVETIFYQEKNQPFERISTKQNPVVIYDYSTIEEIERFKIPLNQWILLNTNIIHGVENITGLRTHLTIIVYKDSIDLCVLK